MRIQSRVVSGGRARIGRVIYESDVRAHVAAWNKRAACTLGLHDWEWRTPPGSEATLEAGYPVPSQRLCRTCGITAKCGLCGKRHVYA